MANDSVFMAKESFMESMNNFIKASKGSLETYFGKLINVTEPEESLGFLQNKNSHLARSIIISPFELFEIARALQDNQSKVVSGPDDPLNDILKELDVIPSSRDISARRPALLKVFSRELGPSTNEQKLLFPIKNNIVRFMSKTEVSFDPNGSSFLDHLKRIRAVSLYHCL